MFGFGSGNKLRKLRKKYHRKLEEARDIQRKGDMKAYALAMDESEVIAKQIQELEKGITDG